MGKLIIKGVLLDEHIHFTLSEFTRACSRRTELRSELRSGLRTESRTRWRTQLIAELVDEGILEPKGSGPEDWLFPSASLTRARKAMRLHQDLQVNMAGIALALELMDQVETLRARLQRDSG